MYIFKKIFNFFFYNPYKIVENNKTILVDKTTVLLKSCRFRFDFQTPENQISIGKGSMVGCDFVFESGQGKISIGDRCFINSGTKLISRSSIVIGDNVTISWGCTIYDHNSHSLDYLERRRDIELQLQDYNNGVTFIKSKNWDVVKSRPIVIENDVWIGFDVVILSGVKVGEGAVIGAGSVVREEVEPWTVVIGNPAKVVKRLK